jgi:hypothetical protein
MTNSKMTKKDYFKVLKEIVKGNEREVELVAFIDHEIELLAKKSAKSGMTATQKANAEIMEKIVNALAVMDKPVTVTELQKGFAELDALSNQKMSALLKKLVDEGRVVKTIDKKKSLFSLPEIDTDEDTDVETDEE